MWRLGVGEDYESVTPPSKLHSFMQSAFEVNVTTGDTAADMNVMNYSGGDFLHAL